MEETGRSYPAYALSVATIPSRLRLLSRVLRRVDHWQVPPTAIFLTVSPLYHRFGIRLSLSDLPGWIRRDSRIEILWRDDLGPINKLIWFLRERAHEHQFVMTIDDDRDYPPTLCADLLRGTSRHNSAVVCARGRCVPASLRYAASTAIQLVDSGDTGPPEPDSLVDIALGTEGVMYPTGVFGPTFCEDYVQRAQLHPYMRLCDDIYLSGYLAARGISRYVVPISREVREHPYAVRRDRFNRAAAALGLANRRDDRLWSVNRAGPFNDEGLADWSSYWSARPA